MKLTLEKLAEMTSSTYQGDKDIELSSVATIESATRGQISFISNPKYIKRLDGNKASVVILNSKLAQQYQGNSLINEDPYLTFAKVLEIFYKREKVASETHPTAVIGDDVSIAENVQIGPNTVIAEGSTIEAGVSIGGACYIGENCHIKENTQLHPNVTINKETTIGHSVIIHSGAVIGADGFGFAPQKDKSWFKILQVGKVEIGNNVEIGANTTIDRAALGVTLIADGVKLDNLIQVGHNVSIGRHTIIASGSMIAGSTKIGEYCQIGGAVAIAGHLKVVDNVVITGKTTVIKSIPKPGVYSSGTIVDENRKWRRNAARFRQLDEMAKAIKRLERKLADKE